MRLLGLLALCAVVASGAVACRGGQTGEDLAQPEDLAPPIKPSGCPAPGAVHPADLKTGFLPAEGVFYSRTVDGDTAHFIFKSGEKVVRFLWVDTEEKGGTGATAFGAATVPVIEGWIAATKIVTVSIEEDAQSPGQPALDAFGRTLGVVFLDGELLQTRIVREGWSAYYTQFGCAPPPIHEALLYAEAEARANERGIWQKGHPTNYRDVFERWLRGTCRPNPYEEAYCK